MAGFILSSMCGFLPMFFLAGIIYWLDRYEKEPKKLLGGVFGWGAVVAVAGALVLQLSLGQGVLILTGSKKIEDMVGATLFAPVTEEVLKGLAVLLVFALFHAEFDSILDGIVYASVTALGFAATEDVLYYFSSYSQHGIGAMMNLVFIRLVMFGWQHAFFTSFTGIGLAIARLNRNLLVKLGAPLLGLCLAMLAHATHNSLLTFFTGLGGITLAALVAWSGWLFMFGLIVYLNYREKRWLAEYLGEEVLLQTITTSQYRAASSFFGQTQARIAALGQGRYRATGRFFQLCGELAHKKRQLALLGEEDGNSQRIMALRGEISRISAML
jgi:protease PrsW